MTEKQRPCETCGYKWLIGVNGGCDEAGWYRKPLWGLLSLPKPGETCGVHTTERVLCETCDELRMWPEGVQFCEPSDALGDMLDPGEPCEEYRESSP